MINFYASYPLCGIFTGAPSHPIIQRPVQNSCRHINKKQEADGSLHSVYLTGCRETVTEPKPYPSFNPQDFPACQEHAQKALQLAVQALKGAATSGPGQQELLQKELAYAEAQVARFANGTAMGPERATAQQRHAELMEGIGALLQPGLNLPVQGTMSGQLSVCQTLRREPLNFGSAGPIWRRECSSGFCLGPGGALQQDALTC